MACLKTENYSGKSGQVGWAHNLAKGNGKHTTRWGRKADTSLRRGDVSNTEPGGVSSGVDTKESWTPGKWGVRRKCFINPNQRA